MFVHSGRSAAGSAPGSGLGGRWFKSSRPDFFEQPLRWEGEALGEPLIGSA